MDKLFFLEIITPERKFFAGDVEMVVLKTHEGQIGILKNHIPLVTTVAVGPLRIRQDGKWIKAVVTEGFIEVTRDKTIILTDTAEWPHEIDINRALEAKRRAEERLKQRVEYRHSQAALARAMARLKVTRG